MSDGRVVEPSGFVIGAHRWLGYALVGVGSTAGLMSAVSVASGASHVESSAGAGWIGLLLMVFGWSFVMVVLGVVDIGVANRLRRGERAARVIAWVLSPVNVVAVPGVGLMAFVVYIGVSLWLD